MRLPTADWMINANCRGQDPDIFFPTNGHNLLTRPAVETCNQCPVQLDCLEYALQHKIDHGIWGGTSERERRRILKGRRTLRDLGLDNNGLRLALDREPRSESGHG